LTANPNAVATLRAAGPCFELTVSQGIVEAAVTAFPPLVAGLPADHPIPMTAFPRLAPGDFMRTCAEGETVVQWKGITSVTVGDQTDGGLAEREVYPSLLLGTLFLADTNKAIE